MDKREDLTQIVKEVQKDNKQFELLYSHIVNKVYYWCYSVVGNEADAFDMTQESMLLIYKNIGKLKNPEAFTSWMYRLIRNHCLNYVQRYKKHDLEFISNDNYAEQFEENVKEERLEHLPHESYDLNETKRLVASFIDNLPRRQKEVITLFYLEEMKIEEIAEVLDYNAGSVKSRLHDGRKNLESQVSKYQKKHNVKLYNISLFAILGLILQEHRDELCEKHDLSYKQNIFKHNLMNLNNLSTLLVSKVLIIITSIVVVGVLLGFIYFSQQEDIVSKNSTKLQDEDISEQLSKHPYIRNINYVSFPVRTSIEVSIELKKDVIEEDVSIIFENEEVPFRQDDRNIYIQVKENGEYKVAIDKSELMFEIDIINENAPELVEVHNYNDYLQLIINDELSQIDYDKSFVEYQGKEYTIPESLKIHGQFDGLVNITLFNKDGCFIKYNLNIE